MTQNGYKDLIAWQKGMELVTAVYDATDRFPSNEHFGLVSQLRRAAVSVPSNIAEGKCHYSNRDFVRFLRHARESRCTGEPDRRSGGARPDIAAGTSGP